MNPKGTCPLAGEDSSCVAEHRKAGTHFLQADPRVLRAKRPSMDGQCGSLRRTMPTCNRPGQMKTIKTVKAMKTGHSDCLPTVSPSSPPSITRSASILPGLSIKLQVYSDSGQYTHQFFDFPTIQQAPAMASSTLFCFLSSLGNSRRATSQLATVAEIGNLNGLNGVWRSSLGVSRRTLLLFFARAERLFGHRESRSFAYRFFMYAKIGD